MHQYKFLEPIRTHLKGLTTLMEYANSRNDGKWASQSTDPERNGVYGYAYNTIKAILTEVFYQEFAAEVMDNIEYGGGYDWLDDLEAAVTHVLDQEAEEQAAAEECSVEDLI